jgi:ribosomal protein L24
VEEHRIAISNLELTATKFEEKKEMKKKLSSKQKML